jgi:hypothetical protein
MLKYDCSDGRTMSVTLKQDCFQSQSDPDFVIDRDGNIRAKITTSFSIPRIVTFEIGYYRFLVEERHEEDYIVDGPNLVHDEYIVFIDDEKNGGRYKLFAVSTYEEIKKFKKKFSDFTDIV